VLTSLSHLRNRGCYNITIFFIHMYLPIYIHSRAIEICSDGPGTHIYLSNRATASCRVNDFAGAIADLQQALTMAPQHGKQTTVID
jgi:hypothetical protein